MLRKSISAEEFLVLIDNTGNVCGVNTNEIGMVEQAVDRQIPLFSGACMLYGACTSCEAHEAAIVLAFCFLKVSLGVCFLTCNALEDKIDVVCDTKFPVLLVVVLLVCFRLRCFAFDSTSNFFFLCFRCLLCFDLLFKLCKVFIIIDLISLKIFRLLKCPFLHLFLENKAIDLIIISLLISFQDLILSMQAFIENSFKFWLHI